MILPCQLESPVDPGEIALAPRLLHPVPADEETKHGQAQFRHVLQVLRPLLDRNLRRLRKRRIGGPDRKKIFAQ